MPSNAAFPRRAHAWSRQDRPWAVAQDRYKPMQNSLILIDSGHSLRMTADERRMLRDFKHLLSPTLDDSYDLIETMKRVPVCTVCPMAQWYTMRDSKEVEAAECFCTAFNCVMYNGGARVVTACDARQDAIDPERRKRPKA